MYQQIDSNKRKTVLLIIIFIMVVVGLGWIFSQLSGYGYTGLVIAVIISLFMTMISWYSGDKIALWSAGAVEIKKEQNPYVYNMVENLCITAGMPIPKVHIINDPGMNAFATGRDPKNASIAITTGCIENLENEELEGVIAHELSHIKNYDIRLMMVVMVLVGIIALLSNWIFRAQFFGSREKNRDNGGQIQAILFIVAIILAILTPIIAELIKLAVSRKREYLADASGALLTRYPEGLARALEKIGAQNRPLQRANNASAHLFIANPFAGSKKVLSNLFSTHPPIEERVKELRKMA